MLIFRAINASWPRRIQFAAFASLTTVSLLDRQANDLRAEWFAFKKIPVPAESLEPQPNEGFDKAIRNLLKEANRLEKKRELDQAINLVERAAKISEESSSLVKIAPDISSTAISEYAKDLRLQKQKVELSQKRVKMQNSNTTVVAASPLKKEIPAKDKAARSARVKPPVAPVNIANKARELDLSESDIALTMRDESNPPRPKSRRNDTTSVASAPTDRFDSDSKPVDLPPSPEQPVGRVTIANNAGNVSTLSASSEESSLDPFFEEMSAKKHVPRDLRSSPKKVVTPIEISHSETGNASLDPENMTLISSSPIDSEHSTTSSNPRPVKLRSRYHDSEALPIESVKSTSDLRNSGTKALVTTASIKIDESSTEQEKEAPGDPQVNQFPVVQVRDSQQADEVDSESNPGDVSPTSTNSTEESLEVDQEEAPPLANSLSPFRIRRSLKLRNAYHVLPLLTPIVTRSTREPVVGRTSIIHWRPAKEMQSVAAEDPVPENEDKTNESMIEIRRMQSDNDRSIIDHVSTGIPQGSARDSQTQAALEPESSIASSSKRTDENRSSASREVRGHLWDNAAVPTFEGTWRPAKPPSENQLIAPLPPKTNRIEQTAFSQPRHSVNNDLRSELNGNSIDVAEEVSSSSIESSSVTADFDETSEQELAKNTESTIDDTEWANDGDANGSSEQSASETRLPASTVSTMLGVFGVALLIAGIWMVRATAGIKHA